MRVDESWKWSGRAGTHIDPTPRALTTATAELQISEISAMISINEDISQPEDDMHHYIYSSTQKRHIAGHPLTSSSWELVEQRQLELGKETFEDSLPSFRREYL